MLHLEFLKMNDAQGQGAFLKRAAGRYFTGQSVGSHLARALARELHQANPEARELRIVDPFAGDGRLITWLIEAWNQLGYPRVLWQVELWDLDVSYFDEALEELTSLGLGRRWLKPAFRKVDAFKYAREAGQVFDAVVTNPPWELLKPDRREICQLPEGMQQEYIAKLREYDQWISSCYPLSQPKRKFAGWGTNLSRVGLEVCLRLTRRNGLVGAVMPASVFADDQSANLRKQLLDTNSLLDLAYYPAEAKQYGGADVASATMVFLREGPRKKSVPLLSYREGKPGPSAKIRIDRKTLEALEYVLPVAFGSRAIKLLTRLASTLPRWRDFEKGADAFLWAGREVDETGSARWLSKSSQGQPLFIKGRMIERFGVCEEPSAYVGRPGWKAPSSVAHPRIVWRDVSRPSQKRRMIATVIPADWAAGNSLGVLHLRHHNEQTLKALLGVINSTTFEFQLRAYLATGHVSLSSLRKVALPPADLIQGAQKLASLVDDALGGQRSAEYEADALVARELYKLTESEYRTVIGLFEKFDTHERRDLLEAYGACAR